jgi:hypothetical protein
LEVLKAVADTGLKPKVVIPTALSDEDRLCQQVLTMGHRRPDIVDKREGGWENRVLSSVDRFAEELRLGALLPAFKEKEGLRVEVLPGTMFEGRARLVLRVNGRNVKPFRGKQARLLGILLNSPRSPVDLRTLGKFINDGQLTAKRRGGVSPSRSPVP